MLKLEEVKYQSASDEPHQATNEMQSEALFSRNYNPTQTKPLLRQNINYFSVNCESDMKGQLAWS